MTSTRRALKKQYIIAITVGSVVMTAIIGGLFLTDNRSEKVAIREKKKEEEVKSLIGEAFDVDSKTSQTAQDRFVDTTSAEVHDLKDQNMNLSTEIANLKKEIQRIAEKSGPKNAANRNEPENTQSAGNLGAIGLPNRAKEVELPPKAEIPKQGSLEAPTIQPQNKIVQTPSRKSFHINIKSPQKSGKEAIKKTIDSYIPATSVISVVGLNGVDAITGGQADSDPTPIAFRIKSLANLPNFTTGHIKECRFAGSASGQISSERAKIRIEKIACVLKDKTVIERQASGYVTGEDGKVGMRGRVVSRKGKALAKAGAAGFVSGFGKAVEQAQNTVMTSPGGVVSSVDPKKALSSGAAGGVSSSSDLLAERWIKEADQIHDIIEIDAGRLVEVVLLEGIDLGHSMPGNIKESIDE